MITIMRSKMKPHIHFERGMWWWTYGGTIISFRTIRNIIAWQRICKPRLIEAWSPPTSGKKPIGRLK